MISDRLVAIYWFLPKQMMRTLFLTISSLAFIWFFDPQAVWVVSGLTVFTYLMAIWLGKSVNKKFPLALGLTGLLVVLFFSSTWVCWKLRLTVPCNLCIICLVFISISCFYL
jgi:hypothetical protein